MSRGKPIGLIGGAFDPVHIGHIHMARGCIDSLDLAEVRFIPTNITPNKIAPGAAPRHRLAMLERALQPYPRLTVSAVELQRGGTSYTIDTLISLRAAEPLQSFFFILGADAFAGLPSWCRWQEITEYVHLIIVDRKPRQQADWSEQLQNYYAKRACVSAASLRARACGYIQKMKVIVPDVSSSLARTALNRDENTDNILPPGIHDYIRENNLYK